MINIQIDDSRVLVTETIKMTAADVYDSGAMDDLLTGAYWTAHKAHRLQSIKIVRKMTGEGLAVVKDAMDERLDFLGLPRRLYTSDY